MSSTAPPAPLASSYLPVRLSALVKLAFGFFIQPFTTFGQCYGQL